MYGKRHALPLGTPRGTRTPGPLLRRQLLYPAELLAHVAGFLERVMGIEPTSPAWKAGALAVVLHPHAQCGLQIIAYPPVLVNLFLGFFVGSHLPCGLPSWPRSLSNINNSSLTFFFDSGILVSSRNDTETGGDHGDRRESGCDDGEAENRPG